MIPDMRATEDISTPREEREQQQQQQRPAITRPACAECQRRKQKCNREWPCNHCQKRKVADKCRFNTVLDDRSLPVVDQKRQAAQQTSIATSQQLQRDSNREDDNEENDDDDDNEEIDNASLEALGYSPAHFLSFGGLKTEKKPRPGMKQYYRKQGDCSQLDHALQVLPPRPYADALVQHFLNVVNFHYYIIHPTLFVKEYEQWWIDKFQNKALPLPWTSLLLMVCACSAQLPNPELQKRLEHDLGQTMQKLSETYHTAGRELYNTIPVGHSHLYTVQQLLHSCFWFKSEARYIECWHALTAGIREGQQLGIHQESIVHVESNFEREMRRRLWCLLSVWDWQIGSLLSRPLILDPTECDVQLPNLALEEYIPSPVLSMKLQAELIWNLSRRFGRPMGVTDPVAIEEYIALVESWTSTFPQPYTFDNPDKRMDSVCPWITLHRFYLHTTSYSMALDPIRPFLAKPIPVGSAKVEFAMRREAVKYALKLMDLLFDYFGFVYPKDAKYRSVLFSIFSVSALLCSAILHDEDHGLPRREECLKAVESSHHLLAEVHAVVPSAGKFFEMLSRLIKKIERMNRGAAETHPRKRARVITTPSSEPCPAQASIGPTAYTMDTEMVAPGHVAPHDTPPNEVWNGDNLEIKAMTHHYQRPGTLGLEPFAPSGLSCINGSFILSGSPNEATLSTPMASTMSYNMALNDMNLAGSVSDGQYQDYNFSNITEADLGALANIWDYGNLNLDCVTPFTGN